MSGRRVLVIDDEAAIRKFLRIALEADGHEVSEADTGRAGLQAAVKGSPDLVVLDLGLPDMDGQDVVKALRDWYEGAIVVLSVRAGDTDKIAALDSGANDYVTKPFSTGELLARVRVALREKPGASVEPVLKAGALEIDLPAHEARLDGARVALTKKEFAVLALLARSPGRLLTHGQILGEVWGPGHVEDTHYLRIVIGHLRQKLGDDPADPRFIENEPGVGYRLVSMS